MTKQEEYFTTVRRHERSNPVNPGKHWVRKHPRFIGYRDPTEVKLLQPTHIADIKGVGGKTSTILAEQGYTTIEDVDRLANRPDKQQELIDKYGVRPHTMDQIFEATGYELKREIITEEPKPPKPISEEPKKPESPVELKKAEIIRKLKAEPAEYRPELYKAYFADETHNTRRAINELIRNKIIAPSRASGYHHFEWQEANVKKVEDMLASAPPGERLYADELWAKVLERDDIPISNHHFGVALSSLEQDGKLQTQSVWDDKLKQHKIRLDYDPKGAEHKKHYEDRIKRMNTTGDLTKLKQTIDYDPRAKMYKYRLFEEIKKKQTKIDKAFAQKWVDEKITTPKEKAIFERFLEENNITGEHRQEYIEEAFQSGWMLDRSRTMSYTTEKMKAPPIDYNTAGLVSITPKKTLSYKKLKQHDEVFGYYSPYGIWTGYKILGRKGTTFHVPTKESLPMMMEKDGVIMYLAPRISDEGESHEARAAQYLEERPDYERG